MLVFDVCVTNSRIISRYVFELLCSFGKVILRNIVVNGGCFP